MGYFLVTCLCCRVGGGGGARGDEDNYKCNGISVLITFIICTLLSIIICTLLSRVA